MDIEAIAPTGASSTQARWKSEVAVSPASTSSAAPRASTDRVELSPLAQASSGEPARKLQLDPQVLLELVTRKEPSPTTAAPAPATAARPQTSASSTTDAPTNVKGY